MNPYEQLFGKESFIKEEKNKTLTNKEYTNIHLLETQRLLEIVNDHPIMSFSLKQKEDELIKELEELEELEELDNCIDNTEELFLSNIKQLLIDSINNCQNIKKLEQLYKILNIL